MKIEELNNLFIGYSSRDNFRILIVAGCDDEVEAQDIADQYVEHLGLEGPMSVREFTANDLNAHFDCDYAVAGLEEE